jgi:hypothetical protein
MSSVLRSVRKRKKGRTLGAVDVIDRAEYTALEVDAKVELIRSLVPVGWMHIEEWLDEEVTALAGNRAPGHRTAPAQGDGVSAPTYAPCRAEASTEDRHDDVEEKRRVINQEPQRVSTKNGLDSSEGGHSISACARPSIDGGALGWHGALFRRCDVALSRASRHTSTGDTNVEVVNLPVPDRGGEPQHVLTV